MLNLYFDGALIMKMPTGHLPFHTPERREHKWKIVDETTGETMASYVPVRIRKPKVITPR